MARELENGQAVVGAGREIDTRYGGVGEEEKETRCGTNNSIKWARQGRNCMSRCLL